jgi:hypothetical protein
MQSLILGAVAFAMALGTAWAQDREGSRGSNPKNTFNIMMNYELGMHCTGFEFAYCCVLPPYNSILAQVVKTQRSDERQGAFAKLLQGDPNVGRDALGRETVLRDADLQGSNFQKYVLTYQHLAQPRNDGRGKEQVSTLISAVEGNSLFMWATVYDQAAKNPDGSLVTGTYNGSTNVVLGDGKIQPVRDSYANGWMNHLYIYSDLEGGNPNNSTLEADKIRLGVDVVFQPDCGPSGQPMGPVTKEDPFDPKNTNTVPNDCGGLANGNLLTFSGEHGTIVYTQMKVLENLPVTLTSPRIWEALGLPLTPFEDTIDFFADPGLVDEDSIRPYVRMEARLHRYDSADITLADGDAIGVGAPVLQNGAPVVGFGTAPIDIPNCERCHSNAPDTPNSPQTGKPDQWDLVQLEYNFWNAYYEIDTGAGDSDWYSRLKSAAISMMVDHDTQHGTSFAANYPDCASVLDCQDQADAEGIPVQNTRMGHEAVICQKCHADNVIAVVKSATGPEGQLIRPISEAIHRNHRSVTELTDPNDPTSGGPIAFNDALGRDGGCQGCHPAHRSDGDMAGYPITLDGENFYKGGDNRLASGGCFVGRDVHSNPNKDNDGAGTPEHLNAVGAWLSAKVFDNQVGLAGSNQATRGIWCTNCHTQLGQELWKAEDCDNLIEGDCARNVRGGEVNPNGDVDAALNNLLAGIGVSATLGRSWLDPKGTAGDDENGPILSADGVDRTHDIWRAADPLDPTTQDANVATIEVSETAAGCDPLTPVDFTATFGVFVCVKVDDDVPGDPSVNVLSFCTTQGTVDSCVDIINANKDNEGAWRYPEEGKVDGMAGFAGTDTFGAPVPFSAATDGRDHWLSPGEPHCADCHAAPYTEQSGNINAFAPFNYPAKASLMRYSRGHRDITCQGCHESIHGLYPVTPNIDTTSYAQAASMNSDDSHGPLKCGACHQVNGRGVHERMDELRYNGQRVSRNFDAAVGWAHTFTQEKSPLDNMCVNCHDDERDEVSAREEEWQEHAMEGRASRPMMNQVEIELLGAVAGTNPATGEGDANIARTTVCRACHDDEFNEVSCSGSDGREWKRHLSEGRVAQTVWEAVSIARTGTTCGW